jgi:hypothetical protein
LCWGWNPGPWTCWLPCRSVVVSAWVTYVCPRLATGHCTGEVRKCSWALFRGLLGLSNPAAGTEGLAFPMQVW